MSSNIDFKALWQQQEATARPDISEVIKNATRVRTKTRNKLILTNGILVLTIIYIAVIVLMMHQTQLTTKIGTALIILGIVFYLIVSNNLLWNLFQSNPEADTFIYLTELLIIRKKQDFIQKVAIKMYFICLSAGMFLFWVEPFKRMTLWGGIAMYVIFFSWMAFVYFYIHPRKMKKQRAEMNAAIEKLQAINQQLQQTKNIS